MKLVIVHFRMSRYSVNTRWETKLKRTYWSDKQPVVSQGRLRAILRFITVTDELQCGYIRMKFGVDIDHGNGNVIPALN